MNRLRVLSVLVFGLLTSMQALFAEDEVLIKKAVNAPSLPQQPAEEDDVLIVLDDEDEEDEESS